MLVCRPPSQLQFKTQWKIMKFTRVHNQNLEFHNLLLFSKISPCL
jgi:GH35 family endo-1,4-beta-xylanase